MHDYKLKSGKLEQTVTGAYKFVENAVTDTYRKIEDTVVGTYKKIETGFVNTFLEESKTDKSNLKTSN